jgi:hypothetical protein
MTLISLAALASFAFGTQAVPGEAFMLSCLRFFKLLILSG